MIHVPAEIPVTTPVDEPTVATAVLLLLQCPPAFTSVSVTVEPAHTLAVPLMPVNAVTDTVWVARQPPGVVYEIVTIPGDTPVTLPVEDTTVATAVLLLLQVPPATASLSVITEPAITVLLPAIVVGAALTVNITVVLLVPSV